jgi:hypothetical protein
VAIPSSNGNAYPPRVADLASSRPRGEFHVVPNLMRSEFALPQDLVEFGAAQPEQRRMPACDAVPAYVSDQLH